MESKTHVRAILHSNLQGRILVENYDYHARVSRAMICTLKPIASVLRLDIAFLHRKRRSREMDHVFRDRSVPLGGFQSPSDPGQPLPQVSGQCLVSFAYRCPSCNIQSGML